MSTFAQGGTACQEVIFREFTGGPLIDPADARFDILDPDGVTLASNQPTTILSPGLHEGCWPVPEAAALGDYIMRFKATINGSAVQKDCAFEVVAAGSIEPAPTPNPFGPCESWEIDETCPSSTIEPAPSDELVEQMRAVSTSILWAESGRRWGACPVTVRPCLRRCVSGSQGLPTPIRTADVWVNIGCGCRTDCSCTTLCEILLDGPVASITAVKIDGETLDPSSYRLDDGYKLVRVDGGCWPSCQDLTAACDEEGSFCVTYMLGIPLDAAAILAHSTLTYELTKRCVPGCKTCRLPANVISKTQSGVSIQMEPSSWIRTLPEVAMWLDAVNPEGLAEEPTVFSPDLPAYRRV